MFVTFSKNEGLFIFVFQQISLPSVQQHTQCLPDINLYCINMTSKSYRSNEDSISLNNPVTTDSEMLTQTCCSHVMDVSLYHLRRIEADRKYDTTQSDICHHSVKAPRSKIHQTGTVA